MTFGIHSFRFTSMLDRIPAIYISVGFSDSSPPYPPAISMSTVSPSGSFLFTKLRACSE
ncbi:hypothetical protein M408DRAFT_332849 [Serendipita vermifera MAFF 305830]|uniref:Uncharacterized protein n=1 Tax=Serendipita vermifera MAFF 305830 TaxID=933852 RepID=A0A0C3ARF4_SERVB|nr:hypothetical protein M408DRAFT_332849 [Serendipita vermifera MAFF 305830]